MVHLRHPLLQPHFLLNNGLTLSYLRGEHGGTGPDAPADHWLGEAALFDAPADIIFLCAPYLQRNGGWKKVHKLVQSAPSLPRTSPALQQEELLT